MSDDISNINIDSGAAATGDNSTAVGDKAVMVRDVHGNITIITGDGNIITMPDGVRALSDLPLNPEPGLCPFKGLQYFDVQEADLYFGRDALTHELIDSLKQHNFLAIVGASGSGKSSLVRAGIVATLLSKDSPIKGSQQWRVHIITPTGTPLKSLAASLTRDSESVTAGITLTQDLAAEAGALDFYGRQQGQQILLVVDQFEELFTLCKNEEERRHFIDNLLTAALDPHGPSKVIITLRADFYAQCAQYDNLRTALEKRQRYIGTMTREELQQVIEVPALQGKWQFEEGLVEFLLQEVGAGSGVQPPESAALPLLSHALLETWQRRVGRTLTFASYYASGRVSGAIAQTAETIYRQELTEEQRRIAQNIFLRLTALGEGTQDTRRRVELRELIPQGAGAGKTVRVLNKLATARLVTMDERRAEVAHEALIQEWPSLRKWLDEDRQGLLIHRRLTETAQEWLSLNKDSEVLLRGTRLIQTREWAKIHVEALNNLEKKFLEACEAEQSRRQRESLYRGELEDTVKQSTGHMARILFAIAGGAVGAAPTGIFLIAAKEDFSTGTIIGTIIGTLMVPMFWGMILGLCLSAGTISVKNRLFSWLTGAAFVGALMSFIPPILLTEKFKADLICRVGFGFLYGSGVGLSLLLSRKYSSKHNQFLVRIIGGAILGGIGSGVAIGLCSGFNDDLLENTLIFALIGSGSAVGIGLVEGRFQNYKMLGDVKMEENL